MSLPLLLPGNFLLSGAGDGVFATSGSIVIGKELFPAENVNRLRLFGELLVILSESGARFVNINSRSTLFFYPGNFHSACKFQDFFFLGSLDGSVHRLCVSGDTRITFDRKFSVAGCAVVAVLALGVETFVFGDERGVIRKFHENFLQDMHQMNGFVLEIFQPSVFDAAVLAVSSSGEIVSMEIVSGNMIYVIQSHGRIVNAAALHGTTSSLALGGEDGSVNVWATDSGKLLSSQRVVDGAITGLAFVGDRKLRGVAYDREFEFSVNF